MRHGIAAATMALALSGPASGQTFLVKDGQPQAEIVISDSVVPVVKLAASELQAYVAKLSGATLPIATTPSKDVPVQVYVGRTPHTDRLKVTDEGLKHGAFRMVSGENWLVLLGRDSSFTPKEPHLRNHGDLPRLTAEWDKLTGEKWGYPYTQVHKQFNKELGIWEQDERGSFNAVCEFLRMEGVRWYLPAELGEIVPKRPTIALPKINKTVQPDFALRYPYQYMKRFSMASRDEILWQLRRGFSQAPDLIGMGGFAHGTNHAHQRPEVKKAHPEYFALWGGQRATEHHGSGAPCLSSPGLFEQNVKYVRAVFDIFDAPLESVMPADGYVSLCQCELCKGKDTPERGWNGQISDYVWDYVNRVAQEVNKTHPNKKVLCFAYGAYMLPPTKIATLSPNILVGICQGRSAFSDPEKRQWIADIRKGWLDKMPEGRKQLVTYDYYLHARPERSLAFIPAFFPHAIAWDLKSLKGVSLGDFIEVYRERDGLATLAANHLNLYVTSRLWWDAGQDVDALLEEYYTLFYGPARDEMKAFIAYCEANWLDLPKSAEKIGRTFELLAKAQEKVAADSVHGQRIALIAGYIKPLKDLREQLVKGRQNVPRFKLRDLEDAKIKMDGILDDPAWQGLSAAGLRELETGRPTVHKTAFRAFWANNALYLGIRCDDPDAKNLVIGATKPDDTNVWNGDCVEVLIETQTHSYYQLAISPSGALMDLDRKHGLNSKWSSRAEVAAHTGQDFWSLEVRIPVAGDLQGDVDPLNGVVGRRPSSTYPWFFNVCRQRVRPKDTELSAFSPTGKRVFHDLMKFAELWMQ